MKRYETSQSDLSRGMTLRNASENRRLVGHLQHLDLQLHQNLVSLQAEIIDLKLSKHKQRPGTSQLGKLALGATLSDPRQVRISRHPRGMTTKNSASSGKRTTGNYNSAPRTILPQISPTQTGLVGKRVEQPEIRAKPASSRRVIGASNGNTNHLAASSNLYRPKSTPDLSTSLPESCYAPSPPKGKKCSSIELVDEQKSRSSDDVPTTVKLNERVSDFLQRPNTRDCAREAEEIGNLKRACSDVIPTINIEEDGEEAFETTETNDDSAPVEESQGFLLDEELFRNSLLLKASRDDGMSSSMPDLRSLGFMDFNEVIDERLRKLQEEIPSEEEMRKIRYLRFRDEPAPPSILTIFEKENHVDLDKIDE